jgi:hypothetical protein
MAMVGLCNTGVITQFTAMESYCAVSESVSTRNTPVDEPATPFDWLQDTDAGVVCLRCALCLQVHESIT